MRNQVWTWGGHWADGLGGLFTRGEERAQQGRGCRAGKVRGREERRETETARRTIGEKKTAQ